MAGPRFRRFVGYAMTMVVAASVVAALILIDSPERMREKRLDGTRHADLANIASVVDCYWTVHGEVPRDMAALADAIRQTTAARPLPSYCHWTPRNDPDTGAPYELEPRGASRFALCATFSRPWPETGAAAEPVALQAENRFGQTRPAGRHCYELAAKELDFDK